MCIVININTYLSNTIHSFQYLLSFIGLEGISDELCVVSFSPSSSSSEVIRDDTPFSPSSSCPSGS